jgi:hypothetical protein
MKPTIVRSHLVQSNLFYRWVLRVDKELSISHDLVL